MSALFNSLFFIISIWSDADHLYDDFPKHWSGAIVCLSGMISIDGKVYRYVLLTTIIT